MKADHAKVARLVKTARGQLDGILKMIEEDRYCLDVSHQLLAAQAVLKKAQLEILRAHMEHCVRDALKSGAPEERDRKMEELVSLLGELTK